MRDLFTSEEKNGIITYNLKKERTVEDLAISLGIPLEQFQLVIINGIQKSHTSEIKDGDKISLFPPLSGG